MENMRSRWCAPIGTGTKGSLVFGRPLGGRANPCGLARKISVLMAVWRYKSQPRKYILLSSGSPIILILEVGATKRLWVSMESVRPSGRDGDHGGGEIGMDAARGPWVLPGLSFGDPREEGCADQRPWALHGINTCGQKAELRCGGWNAKQIIQRSPTTFCRVLFKSSTVTGKGSRVQLSIQEDDVRGLREVPEVGGNPVRKLAGGRGCSPGWV